MKDEISSLIDYIEWLQMHGNYWFLRRDAMDRLKLTENAFKLAAHRLSIKGKLKRVRGDFYILVMPEYRSTGSLPATWFIDALMQYLGQDYYVGLLSAAALHGAAHQQPMTFQVITNKSTRMVILGNVGIEFFYKKNIVDRFYQPIKTTTGMMCVSTPEMTAFDLVRYIKQSGQVNHVATVLCELVEQIKPNLMARLLEHNDVEIAVAQRLGYLLDNLKLAIDLEPLLMVLKEKKPKQRLLVTGSSQSVIKHNRKWHILVNESVEPDAL